MRKINTNKTQILHRIRLKKFFLNKSIIDSYQNEKVQADDDIIVPQDYVYTLAWETDFGYQLIEHPDTVSIPVSARQEAHETETADEAATTRTREDSNPNNPNSFDVNDKSVRSHATRHNDVTPLTNETNEQQPVPDLSKQRQTNENAPKDDENKFEKTKESHVKETIDDSKDYLAGGDITVTGKSENDKNVKTNKNKSPRGGK